MASEWIVKTEYQIPIFSQMGVCNYLPTKVEWDALVCDDGAVAMHLRKITFTDRDYGEA